MTKPTPEQRAKEITEDFMDQEFDDEHAAMRWLTERIAAAIEEAERSGQEAALMALRLGNHGGGHS